MSVTAAVMAGGKSRRMGQDKAWIDVDGRPLIAGVIEVLASVADEVIVVANEPRFGSLGVRVVPDRFPDGGALGGIATGVGAATFDTVLVSACDMPFLDAAVWRLLLSQAEGADLVIPVLGDQGDQLETLHALYTKACLPAMERALAAGRLRVISFFDEVRVRRLAEDAIRAADPTLRSFTNVNTPAELAAALGPETNRS
ncbi:MAG TPA: molybdenum cofactor guanylyltransferase [Candidatus Limnocylindria bacterium]